MIILLLDSCFKINDIIYLRVLIKISLNLISFHQIPPKFWENENLRFWGNIDKWVFFFFFYSFHSFLLKLSNIRMTNLHLKFQTRKWSEYSKMIIFYLFPLHSFSSSQTSWKSIRFLKIFMRMLSKLCKLG